MIGELAGVFFDADGRLVEAALSQRIVTISAEALRGIDEVIAIVSGEAKGEAVRAALTGGLVNAVVADAALCDELLRTS